MSVYAIQDYVSKQSMPDLKKSEGISLCAHLVHCASSPGISSHLSYITHYIFSSVFNGCIGFQDKVVWWGTCLSFDGYLNYFHFGDYEYCCRWLSFTHELCGCSPPLFSCFHGDPHPNFLAPDPDTLHAPFSSLGWLPFVL